MLLDDWRVKGREIDEVIWFSKEQIRNILHEELRWKSFVQDGQKFLTIDQRCIGQLRLSQACLDLFKQSKMDFMQ